MVFIRSIVVSMIALILFSFNIGAQEDSSANNTNESTAAISPDQPTSRNDALEQAIVSQSLLRDDGHIAGFIDGLVEAYMEKDQLAGVTLSIVKDGTIFYQNAYGIKNLSDDNAVSASDTLFRAGSISKTFIWTAIMQLQERGLLNINDPVNDYLPDELKFTNSGFNQPILIRHLMTHSLGLEDSFAGHLFENDSANILAIEDYLQRYRPEQVREVGLSTAYSNYGSALAGLIVARVSGEADFETYADNHIFRPLGMNHSTFREPVINRPDLPAPMSDALRAQSSLGFTKSGGAWKTTDFVFIGSLSPAGSLSTSAHDMARYMNFHLGHSADGTAPILQPETIRTIRTTLFSNAPEINGFAHGFMQFSVPGGYEAYGHEGATASFMSNMVLIPELDFGIFVSTNTTSGRDFVVTLPNLIIEHLFPRTKAETQTPPRDFLARSAKYAGTYLGDRRSYTMIEKLAVMPNGYIFVGITDDGYLTVTSNNNTTRWVEASRNTFQEVDGWRTIAFGENDDGEITKFFPDNGTTAATKVGFFSTPTWFNLIFGLAVVAGIGSVTGAWLRRKRQVTESLNESVSSRLVAFQGFTGIIFIILFALSIIEIAQGGNAIVFEFPPSIMIFMLWAAIILGLVNLFSLPSLYIIWRDGNWPFWRRIRHSLAVMIYFGLIATLLDWNMIGFNYF